MLSPAQDTPRRDVIVIGCSAGGVQMLPMLLQGMPPNLPASISIVLHLAPTPDRYLIGILERATSLPVQWAEQGTELEHGNVYVAPPNAHLLYTDQHLVLSGGARENHARPSINKLFRSAAAVHGLRTIGVLLTGMLDDGVAGLRAIRETGGIAVVQDPEDAPYPDLPAAAVAASAADQVLPIVGIAAALIALAGQPVGASTTSPRNVEIEADMDLTNDATPERMSLLGAQSSLSCPDCEGPMWEIGDERLRRYRCYLGHSHSAHDILARQSVDIESALWSAVRALGERATTLETLAGDSTRLGRPQIAAIYTERAKDTRAQADLARQFVMDLVTRSAKHR